MDPSQWRPRVRFDGYLFGNPPNTFRGTSAARPVTHLHVYTDLHRRITDAHGWPEEPSEVLKETDGHMKWIQHVRQLRCIHSRTAAHNKYLAVPHMETGFQHMYTYLEVFRWVL